MRSRTVSWWFAVAVGGAALVTVGCSSQQPATAPTSVGSPTTTAVTGPEGAATSPSSGEVAPQVEPTSGAPEVVTPSREPVSPSAELAAALECLQGRWTMSGFAVETDHAVATEGRGGDVSFRFGPDDWSLRSTGASDVTVSMGPKDAQVSVRGSAGGGMQVEGDGISYTVEEAEGKVQLELPEGSGEQSMPLAGFLGTMVPLGSTDVDCDDTRATISSRNASVNQVLHLTR